MRRRLNACIGQMACGADGNPCAMGEFCNFDGGGQWASCEKCSKFDDSADCYNDGLPSDGAFDCHACCFDGNVTRFPTHEPTTAAPSTQSPTGTPTTAAPSITFAPTSPYEYAPTENVMPYCRLQSSSACWGNTHRFLAVTANGPFDGIDVGDNRANTLVRSETSTVTARSDGVPESIVCDLTFCVARRRSGPCSGWSLLEGAHLH